MCWAGLVQRGKGRYEFIREGAALAGRTRRRTFEAGGDQPMEYEQDVRNRPAVLDSLTCALSALLNLSVLKSNQASYALLQTGLPWFFMLCMKAGNHAQQPCMVLVVLYHFQRFKSAHH